MAQYVASVRWERENGAVFTDNRYSRSHRWTFDGGTEVPASASPHVVPIPLSDPKGVDPEEAFVAALSSCHMLWFLFVAAKRAFIVDSYRDDAVGVMGKNADGRIAMTNVALRPVIRFSGGKVPDAAEISTMHDEAHHACFIANSVRTLVTVENISG
jgi:organic hydroperoxide reductase OsmC/OhrA